MRIFLDYRVRKSGCIRAWRKSRRLRRFSSGNQTRGISSASPPRICCFKMRNSRKRLLAKKGILEHKFGWPEAVGKNGWDLATHARSVCPSSSHRTPAESPGTCSRRADWYYCKGKVSRNPPALGSAWNSKRFRSYC